MNDSITWFEKPTSRELYMLAGWRQWANAGSVSSDLPAYLGKQLGARKIGELKSDDFYLFQLPHAGHLLRPVIKLEEGYPKEIRRPKNEIYFWGNEEKGIVIFTGDEPHMKVDRYADAFFEIAQTLDVKRIVIVGGVYGTVPYDKDRNITCSYNRPYLKKQLEEYVVNFSNYEGGVSLGSYIIALAKERALECVAFYAFVPAYDLSQITGQPSGFSVDPDFKAWYDIMRRLNHMFGMGFDLTDLVNKSDQLIANIDHEVDEFDRKNPKLNVRQQLNQLAKDFDEKSFMPLDDLWAQELGDIFGDDK